ncbi:Wzz/FepE/Etk N-terminal domain-containing protein [Streptomyces sp. NPDC014779]|uniref:Wzz/FepE/Etk N-terminal domain-containing protein n=1 Tax=unclassified Streptomyces TaxID=2593676 RepID=UPI0036F619C3
MLPVSVLTEPPTDETDHDVLTPEGLVRVLLRRWYVLLLAALVTGAACYPSLRPPPRYQSSAVLVVKPPRTDNQPNQLTNLQPSLAMVSYAVVQRLQSPAGRAELKSAGAHGSYRLTPRNSGTSATPYYSIPTLQIESEQSAPEEADRVVQRVIDVYARHLEQLQAEQKVPAAARLTVDLVNRPGTVALPPNRTRAFAGVGALGVLTGVVCALWTEQYAGGRRARRKAGPAPRTPLSARHRAP